MKTPECCPTETFITWLGSFMPKDRPTLMIFCEDCTRSYQRKMVEQGLCENPEFRPEEA